MKSMVPACLLALAGCAVFADTHVPNESKGDTPLVVANHHSDDICYLIILPAGSQPAVDNDSDQNWLRSRMNGGDHHIKPGETTKFGVKPGSYRVIAESCSHDFRAEHGMTVGKATLLWIGGGNAAAPAGYALAKVNAGVREGCVDAGNPVDSPEVCCSKSWRWENTLHVCE